MNGIYHRSVLKLGTLERDETIRDDPCLEGFNKAPGLYGQNQIAVSNVSSPGDGAAFVLATNELNHARKLFPNGPIFELVDVEYSFCSPSIIFPAALSSIQKIIKRNNIPIERIYFELSDPFSLVGMWYREKLKLSSSQVNLYGGTLSIGHPSGVTALRLVQNSMLALENLPDQFRYAIAATPSISGEGCALLLQRIDR